MLSKKSRHMRSLANFGSRHLIVAALRRRFGMNLGCNLDEGIVKGALNIQRWNSAISRGWLRIYDSA
jgi:hypothetical protein